MDLNWIASPAALYGTLMVCVVACVAFVFSTQKQLCASAKQDADKIRRLQTELEGIIAKLDKVSTDVESWGSASSGSLHPRAINMNQRAEALRMYRRGLDSHSIVATLGIPRADAELLRTVHGIMTERAVGSEGSYTDSGRLQASERSLAYSAEE